jgi:peptidoglycan/LPS O-acetylase OafA/YrhL
VRLGYVPALDGLRAVAIAGVVLYHGTGHPAGGWLGVDLFFVLSGFLITTLLLEEQRAHGRVDILGFYRRRARRLMPALLAVLAVVLVFTGSVFGVVAGLGYFSNVVQMGAPESTMPPALEHLWSLAAEEQFYLAWPLLLFVLLRARLGLAVVLVLAGVAFTAMRQFQLWSADEVFWQRIAYGPDTRSAPILVGCLLALAVAARGAFRFRWAQAVAIGLFAAFYVIDTESFVLSGLPLVLFACVSAVMIVRALDARSLVSRSLAVAPMVFLGRISYSLYLWHAPIFLLFGISATEKGLSLIPALGLSLVAATASYYFIELPILRRRPRSTMAEPVEPQRPSASAAAAASAS